MDKIEKNGLKISSSLYNFINEEAIPGTNIKSDEFWNEFSNTVNELAPVNKELLKKRDEDGPHLIFIPEVAFSITNFLDRIKKIYNKYGKCVIAISEGIQDKNNKLISQKILKSSEYDAHVMFNFQELDPWRFSI